MAGCCEVPVMTPEAWGDFIAWVACIILAFVAFTVALARAERRDKRGQKSVPKVRRKVVFVRRSNTVEMPVRRNITPRIKPARRRA